MIPQSPAGSLLLRISPSNFIFSALMNAGSFKVKTSRIKHNIAG